MGTSFCCFGILFCVFGLAFGLAIYTKLKNLPVHRAMREISELIYETCKTYLITQGKFLLLLEAFIAVVIVLYFGVLLHYEAARVIIILAFSMVGIMGSFGVAWFGIRVNTFANSRTAFAGLRGKPFPIYHIPLEAGMSIGMMLISVELLMMLFILLFIPGDYAGPCFIGFAIGESLGAAALRIAGGIFTKIADIGSDLMKIVFKIKEDDARNPGVIADCTGDNAGDSVGPSADGFETYGVTGVALITFILLGVKNADPAVQSTIQVQLLVWIFVMRIAMLVASAAAYFLERFYFQGAVCRSGQDEFRIAADFAGVDYVAGFDCDDLCDFVSDYSGAERRHEPVVEAFDDYFVRNSGGRDYSGVGEGVYFDGIAACAGSGGFGGRRRGVAGNFVGVRGWEFFGLLHRAGDGLADVHQLPGEFAGAGRFDDCGAGVCVWTGGVWISGDGAGDDCGGFLWAGDGQRAIGV